tara:strand:+ start:594 stop:698 length:105 start_codon:yes stop_codon:yes gene_type:complete
MRFVPAIKKIKKVKTQLMALAKKGMGQLWNKMIL